MKQGQKWTVGRQLFLVKRSRWEGEVNGEEQIERIPGSSVTVKKPMRIGWGSLNRGQRKYTYGSIICHPVGSRKSHRVKMVLKRDKDVLISDGKTLGRGLQWHISGILLLSLF